jgi:hypothetical protein
MRIAEAEHVIVPAPMTRLCERAALSSIARACAGRSQRLVIKKPEVDGQISSVEAFGQSFTRL